VLSLVDTRISGNSRQVESSLVKNLMLQEKALTAYLTTHCASYPKEDLTQQDPVDEESSMTSKSLFDLTCESLCRICLLLVVESLHNLESHMWPTQSPTFTPQDHATSLRKTMTALTHAVYTPICKAKVLSAPLHFLHGFYERRGDHSGTQWCR
jgi:hypothetical protein